MVSVCGRGRGQTKYVLEAADPDGVLIRLARRQWERHIAVKHPEVQNHDDIRRVIENPQLVIVDRDDGTEHHFYAQGLDPYPKLYLHVVVAYRSSNDRQIAEVKTAFFVRKPVEGENRWVNIRRSLL